MDNDQNTEKSKAYNLKSDIEIGQIAEIATENSKPLVACADGSVSCSDETNEENSNNEDDSLVSSTPTPTSIPTEKPYPTIKLNPPITTVPNPPANCGCDNTKLPCLDVYICRQTE